MRADRQETEALLVALLGLGTATAAAAACLGPPPAAAEAWGLGWRPWRLARLWLGRWLLASRVLLSVVPTDLDGGNSVAHRHLASMLRASP